MEIFLIRHTTPDVKKGVFYGQTDLALTASFEQEFKVLKPKLPPVFDIVYSSPLQRCAVLAHEISDVPAIDPLLKELDFGDWEMKEYQQIEQNAFNSWMADFVNISCPNGESFLDLYKRIETFWKKLPETDHEKIAVVCHGGVIRSILAMVLGLPLENCFRLEVDYGSVSKVSIRSKLTKVEYINR